MEQAVINFAAYEDATESRGIVNVTMPSISFLTQVISGAGIAGEVEAVIIGHISAMTLGLNFRVTTKDSMKLTEPRLHILDLRAPQQAENDVTGETYTQNIKHVFKIIPKSYSGGKIAPNSTTDASGEYVCRYWATYIDGERVLEIDPVAYICFINGVDYLAGIRKALGK